MVEQRKLVAESWEETKNLARLEETMWVIGVFE